MSTRCGSLGSASALYHTPNALRRRRHVEARNAECTPEGIDDCIHYRWAGAYSACLAGSLDAQRIVHTTHVVRLDGDGGHLVGPRNRVIHQACGHELAGIWIVDSALH